MVNIVFFGSSDYSVIILKKLLEIKDFNILAVFTKTDKPVGRKQEIISNPIADFAKQNKLTLFQPEEFDHKLQSTIENLKPDLGLVVAFGPPYFTQEMIDIPKYKIVNIHPSPLPKYRGATPGPWQIINGEITSAVTFFQIDALPDHGLIITQLPFKIENNETATSFYQKAFNLASEHLESVLKSYISDQTNLVEQDHTQKSYFPKFTKESAQIDWNWDSDKINRFVRALNPWPIAWTYVTNNQNQKSKMKIFSINIEPIEVQIEGKKITKWSEISKYYTINKT
ncbi:MAG: methionyl-tRNA formyltransferase [Candidatus Shapirobacteria bacterium]|jgi:methionyl-tRNA formyltransferase